MKNKPICLEKKGKKETKPKYCGNKNLTPIQEEECLNFDKKILKDLNKPLEYPISFGRRNYSHYNMREFIPPSIESNGKIEAIMNRLIQLRSDNGDELVIARGKVPPFCLECNMPFKEIDRITIPTKNIIGWSKNGEVSTDASAAKTFGAIALFIDPTAIFLAPFGVGQRRDDFFQITYFDEKGIKQDFHLVHWTPNKSKIPNLIERFLSKITGLQSGEIRSDEELKPILLISLKNLEIERKRLKDILFISESQAKSCMIFNQEQYPNLYRKYQSKVESINELKLKLAIPIDDEKICN